MSIADVARDLGVGRPTVYRYFAGTDDLIGQTALRAAKPFIDDLSSHVRDITDPGEAVVRALAYVIENLPSAPLLGDALSPGSPKAFAAGVTSGAAYAFGDAFLRGFNVDWPAVGFNDARLAQLAEQMLRTLQSLIVDPGSPPRTGDDLVEYLNTWVRPAVDKLAAAARL